MAKGDGPIVAVFVTWLFGVALTIAFWGGVIYVAHHFIAKYW